MDLFVLQDRLPKDSPNQYPKLSKVWPSEVQGNGFADLPPDFTKNQEFNHFLVAIPKTTSSHYVFHPVLLCLYTAGLVGHNPW